ncbi:putative sodium:solute symporter, VC_2705 subfamily [Archaeoglobus sulfaticallidus PM70-1]|uniref:Putative sodium:solute symporter, VC_2705 subfamily n=1 Tax=Archaeoglobus sulfaticallidus PM70-1 TaxID=387631 RepID=N0BJH3_9EURY|nr:VC_2705 family sodium/solute symporter [Archaeoglobus sulfaticallidus]AGK60626.1 putative sodium:solute symporter, VC_2705 subfamily [Archaeoglobus sulfaticallidus PM70-1]
MEFGGKNAIIAFLMIYFAIVAGVALTGNTFTASAIAVFGSLFIYVIVALLMRTQATKDFYVAGRSIGSLPIGSSIASNWMSGASFVSMAGAIAVLGYDSMPYIIGWTLGYCIAAFMIAPFIRKSNTYTVPEFVETRASNWSIARVIAVVMLFIVSFTYLVAQLVATGVIIGRFLGMPAVVGAFLGSAIVILFAGTGGWRSVVWVQVTQYWILITAYWIAFLTAAYIAGIFKPWPHFGYGDLLNQLEANEIAHGLNAFTEPFTKAFGGGTGQINWIFSAICLMLGTVGLPHVLSQFYLVRNVRTARYGVGWGLTFIALLYLTAPVYAILARYAFSSAWGMPIDQVKQLGWVQKWLPTGLIHITDLNKDGILQPVELSFHKDIVVVGMPDMFGLPWFFATIVAIGGLAAALSTANGLLMVMTVGATRDIYKRFINPNVSERREIWVGRVMLVVLAVISGLAGARALQDPTFSKYVALLVGWAFVFATASFTPVIILGIFWKGLNRYGIVAGMVAGMGIALPYVLGVGLFGLEPITIFGGKIGTLAWGIIAFFANLIVSVIVSLATNAEKANPPETIQFVEELKTPE